MNFFTKVPEEWREIIYYFLAVLMIASIVFGFVTTDEVMLILDRIITAISGLGFLMAGANTNNGV